MAKAKKSAVDEAVKGAKRGAAKGWNDSMAVANGSAKILMDSAKAIEKQVFPYTHSGSKFATHRREAAADAVWNVKNILRRALRSVGEKISEGVTEAGRLTDLSRMGERQALPPVDSPPMFQPQGFPTVPPAEANREQRWKVEDKPWGDLLQ